MKSVVPLICILYFSTLAHAGVGFGYYEVKETGDKLESKVDCEKKTVTLERLKITYASDGRVSKITNLNLGYAFTCNPELGVKCYNSSSFCILKDVTKYENDKYAPKVVDMKCERNGKISSFTLNEWHPVMDMPTTSSQELAMCSLGNN